MTISHDRSPGATGRFWSRAHGLIVVAVAASVSLGVRAASAQRFFPGGPPMPTGDSTVLITLGTGMPVADPNRSGPATAVVVGQRVFLFDAGPGVERRLAAAGLPIDRVTALFITHLHTDHTLGYPDLIFTSWVMGRKSPLEAYGPPGLQRMTDHLIAAYAEDTLIRVKGLEGAAPGGYRVDVHEIKAGVVYDSGGVRVTAFNVLHGSWPVAFGYRIDTPTKHIVISGDTRPSDEVVKQARGVDILVHEVYPEARAPKAPYWKSFHTSDVELGRLAAKAGPKLLVITHVVWFGATPQEILAAVKRGGFSGHAVVATDLDRF